MTILTTPKGQGTIEPYLEILDGTNFDVIWTNNPKFKDKNKERRAVFFKGPMEVIKSYPGDSNMSIDVYGNNQNPVEFSGDLFFRIYNQKNKKLLCRFEINTSFMDM